MRRTMLGALIRICQEHWLALVVFLVGGISQTVVGLVSITFFQRLLDGVVSVRQFSELSSTLFWYVVLTVVNHVLFYLEGYPRSVLSNGAFMWAKLRAMKSCTCSNPTAARC